jgi:hypothetical protein
MSAERYPKYVAGKERGWITKNLHGAAGETRTEMLRESAWQSLPKTEHFIKVYVEQINQSSTNDYAMALDST